MLKKKKRLCTERLLPISGGKPVNVAAKSSLFMNSSKPMMANSNFIPNDGQVSH